MPAPSIHPPRRRDASAEELASRAQRGSLSAYSDLVRMFEGRLYNFLLRRTGSPSDAEDLAQEAFIRAWQRISTYRSEWRFSTWLFTIASRLAISKRRRPGPRLVPMLPDAPSAAPEPALPRDTNSRSRIWAIVEETLTPDQQAALWLRYVEDMAIRDIARVMSRTQVSVRVMLFRCRAALAQTLAREPALADEIAPIVRLQRPAAKRGLKC